MSIFTPGDGDSFSLALGPRALKKEKLKELPSPTFVRDTPYGKIMRMPDGKLITQFKDPDDMPKSQSQLKAERAEREAEEAAKQEREARLARMTKAAEELAERQMELRKFEASKKTVDTSHLINLADTKPIGGPDMTGHKPHTSYPGIGYIGYAGRSAFVNSEATVTSGTIPYGALVTAPMNINSAQSFVAPKLTKEPLSITSAPIKISQEKVDIDLDASADLAGFPTVTMEERLIDNQKPTGYFAAGSYPAGEVSLQTLNSIVISSNEYAKSGNWPFRLI